MYHLSDEQTEYQIRDRLSFRDFLGLSSGDKVLVARTIWTFKEELTKKGVFVYWPQIKPSKKKGLNFQHEKKEKGILKFLILLLIIINFCVSLSAQDSIRKRRFLSPTIEFSGGQK